MPDRVEPFTARRVLERLGHTAPPRNDWAGLAGLYQSWCRNVPADNVLDLLALRAHDRAPLPGGAADAFFEAWLADGAGGTSWPTANALHALLKVCGFEVRRVAGFVGDVTEPNHGSVIVEQDGEALLLDTTLLCEVPVRLPSAEKLFIDDPIHPVRAEPTEEGWVVEWSDPFGWSTLRARLSDAAVDHAFFLERYELSPMTEPLAGQLEGRRNVAGGVVGFVGAERIEKARERVTRTRLSGADLDLALGRDLGLSKNLVERLRAAGALDS